MSIRVSTALTAGLLSVLLAAGSIATVHAGDGCEKGKTKADSTSTLWSPATTAQQTVASASVRP
ncbi:MAG: hypothetical protein ACM3ST_07005 [Bdellovibrio bacteriovorus]